MGENPRRDAHALRSHHSGGFLKLRTASLALLFLLCLPKSAPAKNEIVTVPVIVADYYAWAYYEAFEDKADIYAWSTAGVDTLGWSLILVDRDPTGLFFVNLAGVAKTLYPVPVLLWSNNPAAQERAWIALGTHAATLLSLELLGKPALSLKSTMGPRQDGLGLTLAMQF